MEGFELLLDSVNESLSREDRRSGVGRGAIRLGGAINAELPLLEEAAGMLPHVDRLPRSTTSLGVADAKDDTGCAKEALLAGSPKATGGGTLGLCGESMSVPNLGRASLSFDSRSSSNARSCRKSPNDHNMAHTPILDSTKPKIASQRNGIATTLWAWLLANAMVKIPKMRIHAAFVVAVQRRPRPMLQ